MNDFESIFLISQRAEKIFEGDNLISTGKPFNSCSEGKINMVMEYRLMSKMSFTCT